MLPYGKKDLIVASDLNCNLHLFRLKRNDGASNCLARPIHVIFNAHAKMISDLVFMTIPVPQSHEHQTNSSSFDYQTSVATCSYDGYLKVWTMEQSAINGGS